MNKRTVGESGNDEHIYFGDLNKKFENLYEKEIESSQEADEAQETALKDPKDVKTRSLLTITFLIGFFSVLIFFAFFVLLYNRFVIEWAVQLKAAHLEDKIGDLHFLELDKVLAIMISALGTSLGFIIGYYFKGKS